MPAIDGQVVSEVMRAMGKRGGAKKVKKGFAVLSAKDRAKRAREGAKARWAKKSTQIAVFVALLLTGFAARAIARGNPAIKSIVSGGSFGARSVADGSFATIFGSGLADKEYIAGPAPLPKTLGGITVTVCEGQSCVPAQIAYANPSQLNVLLPSFPDLPTVGLNFGPAGAICTIYVSADKLASNVIQFFLWTYAPDIFFEGYDCLIDPRYQFRDPKCGLTSSPSSLMQATRGAITDEIGRLVYSGKPAKLGQYYTIWLTGLRFVEGKPNPDLALDLGNIPAYSPSQTLNPVSAPIVPSFVGPSPQFPGLVQINFQLPIDPSAYVGYASPWPCGTYQWELDLSLQQGGNDNTAPIADPLLFQIPVAVNPGDVPCK